MPIDCFTRLTEGVKGTKFEKSFAELREKFENGSKGMDDAKARRFGVELALSYHEVLHNELNELKGKVGAKKAKYLKPEFKQEELPHPVSDTNVTDIKGKAYPEEKRIEDIIENTDTGEIKASNISVGDKDLIEHLVDSGASGREAYIAKDTVERLIKPLKNISDNIDPQEVKLVTENHEDMESVIEGLQDAQNMAFSRNSDIVNKVREEAKRLLEFYSDKKNLEDKYTVETEKTFDLTKDLLEKFLKGEVNYLDLEQFGLKPTAKDYIKKPNEAQPDNAKVEEVKPVIKAKTVAEPEVKTINSSPPKMVRFEFADGSKPTGEVKGVDADGNLKVTDKKGYNYTVKEKDILEKDGVFVRDPTPRDLPKTETDKPTEPQKKSVAKSLRDAAKVLREAKLGGEGTTSSDITGIVRIPLAAALEGAATIIEAGGTIANAISHAVKEVRKYLDEKDISHTAKNVEKEVRDYFKSIGLIEAEKETTVKQDIKDATQTGKITGDKVVMSQKEALKKQIQDVGRGFTKGKAAGTADVDASKKQLSDIIEDAKKQGVFDGEIGGKVVAKLANDLLKMNSVTKAEDFAEKLDKILDNIEYEKDLQTADKLKSSIAKAVKSKARQLSASTKGVIAEFTRLKPDKVQSVTEYNEIANAVMSVANGVKVKADVSTKYETFEISNEKILDYVEKENIASELKARLKFEETYNDLVEAGIIDPASMSLKEMKEIVDAINGESEDVYMDAAEKMAANENKMKALRSVVEYNKIGLDGYDTTPLSKQEAAILSAIQKIDVSNLPAPMLVKLNDAINEISINDNFIGSGEISLIHTVQQNIPAIKQYFQDNGIKNFGNPNVLAESLASIHLLHEFMVKNSKAAAELQRLSGTFDVFNAHSRAQDLQMTAVNEYQKIKQKMGGGIDKTINRFRRGILADVANNYGGTPEEIQKEFDRRKNWIKVSAERLSKSEDKTEQATGKIYQQAYDELLKDAGSYAEVLSNSNRSDQRNSKLVDYWREKFADRESMTREDAELFNNKVWDGQENYTSTKVKALKGKVSTISKGEEDLLKETFISKNINHKASGTKTKKSNQALPSTNTVLDLDFDRVQAKRYYETNYDVETGKHISFARLFFANEGTSELFGGQQNKLKVRDALSKSIRAQKGTPAEENAILGAAAKLTSGVMSKGVRLALGGISQSIKQTSSVFFATAPNMGKDIDLLAKAAVIYHGQRKGAVELMKPFSIGIRGRKTAAGTNREIEINDGGSANVTTSQEGISRIRNIGESLHNGIMYTLSASDAGVAKTTWLAYYMKSLRKQGVETKDIDLSTEAQNPNQVAAAYAEQMVSRSQTPNDPTALGNFYKDKAAGTRLIKNLLLPFSTFSTNQRIKMTNDAQKILYGGEKGEALKSLAGTAIESTMFNAIKVFVIGAAVKAGVNAFAMAFGFRDDEDEAKDENKSELTIKSGVGEFDVSAKTKKVVANAVSDYFFSGMGSLTQNSLNASMNWLYKSVADEYHKGGDMQDKKYQSLFYVPWEYTNRDESTLAKIGNSGTMGTLAPVVQQIDQVLGNADQLINEDLTEDAKTAMAISLAINLFALAGLSDADLTNANTQLKRMMDKKGGLKEKQSNEPRRVLIEH